MAENTEDMIISNEIAVPSMDSLGIFGSNSNFALAARTANAFSKSSIVPKDYQGSAANCLIAIDMASRLKISPMMVMQQLYVVNGRPSWSSSFLVAMINGSKRFSAPLSYEITGEGENKGCLAYAIDHAGKRVEGPRIDMKMAKDEGWSTKSGSKWKTMPEVMLRYRAAAFFARLHCGDLTMGFWTAEESQDVEYVEVGDHKAEVEREIAQEANTIVIDEYDINTETGEIAEEPVPQETPPTEPPQEEPTIDYEQVPMPEY